MGAGLIVVGSRGRGSLRSAVLGSVSRTLSTSAHRPVVIVARAPPSGSGAGEPSIVCGTDGSGACARRHTARGPARGAARLPADRRPGHPPRPEGGGVLPGRTLDLAAAQRSARCAPAARRGDPRPGGRGRRRRRRVRPRGGSAVGSARPPSPGGRTGGCWLSPLAACRRCRRHCSDRSPRSSRCRRRFPCDPPEAAEASIDSSGPAELCVRTAVRAQSS